MNRARRRLTSVIEPITMSERRIPYMNISFFKASLDQSALPAAWKHAWLIPVFKKGERARPSNYRPISLTCIACKCLEHIIHSNIMDHLDNNAILSDFQHGFRKKRSCDTQLKQTVHDLAKCLHDGEQIDAVLFDFSKAFDKVPHARLEAKLNYYGIRGNTLQWIKCFLSQRSQQGLSMGMTSSLDMRVFMCVSLYAYMYIYALFLYNILLVKLYIPVLSSYTFSKIYPSYYYFYKMSNKLLKCIQQIKIGLLVNCQGGGVVDLLTRDQLSDPSLSEIDNVGGPGQPYFGLAIPNKQKQTNKHHFVTLIHSFPFPPVYK